MYETTSWSAGNINASFKPPEMAFTEVVAAFTWHLAARLTGVIVPQIAFTCGSVFLWNGANLYSEISCFYGSVNVFEIPSWE